MEILKKLKHIKQNTNKQTHKQHKINIRTIFHFQFQFSIPTAKKNGIDQVLDIKKIQGKHLFKQTHIVSYIRSKCNLLIIYMLKTVDFFLKFKCLL